MLAEQHRVYSVCHQILRDRDEAQSATQDVFFKAHRALRTRDSEPLAEPTRWLMRIAHNTCLDRLRSPRWTFWHRRRSSLSEEEWFLCQTPSRAPGSEDEYYARQLRKRLATALAGLSARQRTVFALRLYEELTIPEIAHALDLNLGTTKIHMHRALTKLRVELQDLRIPRN